ncbi:Terpenoid cyclases/Protein prenyltransferases superfamily protein [Euphorbia peplus]|nr:Terpenoid cyclases/Protein prenyltransferases superfamily protein [Euphorbia peplus]
MANLYVQESDRPLANFPPSCWGHTFASFPSLDNSEYESMTKEVEEFKEHVKDMLIQSTKDVIDNIEFIELLCRLGLSYHFDSEIDQQLSFIFTLLPSLVERNDYDLYTTALLFRILRQHGFKMSCNVFGKFMNKGEFEKSLMNDVKGILSLYEATFLAVRGEDVLVEALRFTKKHLETLVSEGHGDQLQKKHIENALFSPFHQSVNRVQAREYISLYEEDESRNETLLKFAKLDFNRLQCLYKQELGLLARWWKDLNFVEYHSHLRDRIAECYFWAFGSQFQPEFGLSRIMIAKYTVIVTVLDDTYDSFGNLDELEPLTAAIQRGTLDATDELPEYMKAMFKALIDLHKEGEAGGRNSFVIESFKKLVRCALLEKKWFVERYNPPLDEYLENASITISTLIYPAASFIGMENMVDIDEYNWLQKNSKIERLVDLFCRLNDDILDDKVNEVSCIKCYMKDYGVSRDKAIDEIQKRTKNTWKAINEEYIKLARVSRILANFYLNESRTICFMYQHGDSFTNPENMKDNIASLFLHKLL